MGHALNDDFLADYGVRLERLAKRVDALGRRAGTVESEPGTVLSPDLESARAGLRLAASVISEARKISGEVCIQLGSMSERLNEIAAILDRSIRASRAGEDSEAGVARLTRAHVAPVRLH